MKRFTVTGNVSEQQIKDVLQQFGNVVVEEDVQPEIDGTTMFSLLVNTQDLEDDDRYDFVANAFIESGADDMTIEEIAEISERSIEETIVATTILFNEGYIEIN